MIACLRSVLVMCDGSYVCAVKQKT